MKIQEVTKYRLESEREAIEFIEKVRGESSAKGYSVKKSSYTYKTKKSKGEIIDDWYIVEICVIFAEEA